MIHMCLLSKKSSGLLTREKDREKKEDFCMYRSHGSSVPSLILHIMKHNDEEAISNIAAVHLAHPTCFSFIKKTLLKYKTRA